MDIYKFLIDDYRSVLINFSRYTVGNIVLGNGPFNKLSLMTSFPPEVLIMYIAVSHPTFFSASK